MSGAGSIGSVNVSLRGSISEEEQLSGALSPHATLSGKISDAATKPPAYPPYTGQYQVTPSISGEQVLETKSTTEGANPQAKEVTPTTAEQQVLPDSDQGYNYLSQVTVKPIPYSETENTAGGLTVTIA